MIEILLKSKIILNKNSDYWITLIEEYIKDGFKLTKSTTEILGGFRYDYKISNFTYVCRTTEYWGQNYIIYNNNKYFLTPKCRIKLIEYFYSFKKI
jgi:hypothetical protein